MKKSAANPKKPTPKKASSKPASKSKAKPPAKPKPRVVQPEPGELSFQPKRIPLGDILIDAGTQTRQNLDQGLISDYCEILSESLKCGHANPFPAVDVFRTADGRIFLVDGFHRYFSHQQAGETAISCIMHSGTLNEAIMFACGANAKHGLRRSNADRRHSAKLVISMPENKDLSNVAIAKIANVSESLIRSLRHTGGSTERSIVRDGKPMKIQTGNIGHGKEEGKPVVKKSITAGKDPSEANAPTAGKSSVVDGEKPREEPPETPSTKSSRLLIAATDRLESVLDQKEGMMLMLALQEGTLDLTDRDVRDFSESSDARIKKIFPLVMYRGIKPKRAYEILDGGLSKKALEEAELLCIANGGQFVHQSGCFKITIEKIG